jgi:methyltransferase (TIGR00027 family)
MAAETGPSLTARRVAAYRLAFERVDAPYGDPAADERLARHVAGDEPFTPSEGMWRHLQARTAFFDRVVVNAMERGVGQVVSIGAGYDGRSLRYAKPGVKWWEIDHPVTQADKRAALEGLGLAVRHIAFVPFDLAWADLAGALVASGFQPDGPAVLLCEGVAVYLDVAVLAALLGELRSLAAAGTRLAISLRREGASGPERRPGFEAAVAAMGEPARNDLTVGLAAPLLARARWRPVEISERARQAGFLVAAPEWAPPGPGARPSAGRTARFMEQMLYRGGTEHLGRHLELTYGVGVKATRELDLGVHRVDVEGGASWVARVYPSSRPVQAARHDADVLAWLRHCELPSEQLAAGEPVSVLEGQAVLVTLMAAGRPPLATPATFAHIGALLGGLHRLEPGPAARRPGGAWHHLVFDAGVTEEAAACADLLAAARPRVAPGEESMYSVLADEVARLDGFSALPHAFGHADLVPANLVQEPGGHCTVVDWAGAGWAPRVATLGCVLWAAGLAGAACVQGAVSSYGGLVRLGADEIGALRRAMYTRPLVLAAWTFATGRNPLAKAVGYWQDHKAAVDRAWPVALAALTEPVRR